MEKIRLEGMLTVRQVASFFHVSLSTVRRWSDKGVLKCYYIGSRGDRRYHRNDVFNFLQKSTRHLHTGNYTDKNRYYSSNRQACYFN